jgi:hypothetical protein
VRTDWVGHMGWARLAPSAAAESPCQRGLAKAGQRSTRSGEVAKYDIGLKNILESSAIVCRQLQHSEMLLVLEHAGSGEFSRRDLVKGKRVPRFPTLRRYPGLAASRECGWTAIEQIASFACYREWTIGRAGGICTVNFLSLTSVGSSVNWRRIDFLVYIV